MKTPKLVTTLIAALTGAALADGGFTEPPAVLYGTVTNMDAGTTHQVVEGALAVTLTNNTTATNSVTLTGQLKPTGTGGAYSYRIAIPQRYLPTSDQLDSSLAVGAGEQSFHFDAITVDGQAATSLDPAQSLLKTSFSKRANEHRLDLVVTMPRVDTDGDGMPDWWENQYGLNPNFAGDATHDLDGDGDNNLTEFLNASRPDLGYAGTRVVALSKSVPQGGVAGFFLRLDEPFATPNQIALQFTQIPAGLTFKTSAGTLGLDAFTYADILTGGVWMEAAADFPGGEVKIDISESIPGSVSSPVETKFDISAYNPSREAATPPAIWLGSTTTNPDWSDLSGNQRDAYQPDATALPTLDPTGADFAASDFFYLDDRGFASPNATTFIALRPDVLNATDQSLLNLAGTQIAIGGSADPMHAQSIAVRRAGQVIHGPAVQLGQSAQLTLAGNSLAIDGLTFHQSAATQQPLAQTFATIGATRGVTESAASQFFDGAVHEIIVYGSELEPRLRSRIEDYQRSRWDRSMVWDLRNETAPLAINGIAGVSNIINAGWGSDTLTGAELSDVLRGGPGEDTMNGGAGADRFHIFNGDGKDTITGFSESEGDILDLTAIFGTSTGTPDQHLTLRLVTTRVDGAAPIASTVIEWNSGDDLQSVTLMGLPLSGADLPRLTGSGAIRLGGPRFPMSVELAAANTQIFETFTPSQFTVRRSGNTAGSASIQLSFLGTATIEDDYSLVGVSGTGAIRVVNFAPGETEKQITIQPALELGDYEKETIIVSVLPSDQATTVPAESLVLTLEDPPNIVASVLVPHAQRLGQVPGLIQFSRTGPIDQPLTVALAFSGDAKNGIDFDQISPALTFPAGVREVEVEVTPSETSPVRGRAALAQISAEVEHLSLETLAVPPTASVLIIDGVGAAGPTDFASWTETHFPGNTDPGLRLLDSDNDLISNLAEYMYGTDPNVAEAATKIGIKQFVNGGQIEIHLVTAGGLTDGMIELQHSPDLGGWGGVDNQFDVSLRWLPDGRIERTYRSRLGAENVTASGYYRVMMDTVPVPVPANAFPVGTVGTVGDLSQMVANPAAGSTVEFEWRASAGYAFEFTADGNYTGAAPGTGEWIAAQHNVAPGEPSIGWRFTRLDTGDHSVAPAIRRISVRAN